MTKPATAPLDLAAVRQRFDSKWIPEPNTGCHFWLGHLLPDGYGQLRIGKRMIRAHRLGYELAKGPVPVGLELDHLCRQPSCVNADHLEAVTHRENMLRSQSMVAVNARLTHCRRGHPFDAENTQLNERGWRWCRACRKAYDAKRGDRHGRNA